MVFAEIRSHYTSGILFIEDKAVHHPKSTKMASNRPRNLTRNLPYDYIRLLQPISRYGNELTLISNLRVTSVRQ